VRQIFNLLSAAGQALKQGFPRQSCSAVFFLWSRCFSPTKASKTVLRAEAISTDPGQLNPHLFDAEVNAAQTNRNRPPRAFPWCSTWRNSRFLGTCATRLWPAPGDSGRQAGRSSPAASSWAWKLTSQVCCSVSSRQPMQQAEGG